MVSLLVSDGTPGGFDEQEGAKDLLLPKRLLVLARRIVGPVTFTGLARLLTGGTHVIQHPVSFVRVLVRVRGLFARLWSFIKLHA